MSKVTSKLQISIPKAMADRYGVKPGDDLRWEAAGDVLRLVPSSRQTRGLSLAERLGLFDRATARQRERDGQRDSTVPEDGDRGWRREDAYDEP